MFTVGEIARIVRGELTRGGDARPSRVVHDSRRTERGDLFVALAGARADGHAFLGEAFARGACAALVSKRTVAESAEGPTIVVPDTLAALQQLAAAWRDRLSATIVAVTGSNGKTTTRALLAHLLRAGRAVHEAPENYNTEIGLPLALLAAPASSDVGVFELGTAKPGEIAALVSILRPTTGILTGVGPSHLGGFGSVEAIAEEKWDLARGLPPDGLVLVNGDAEPLRRRAARDPHDTLTVGLGDCRFCGRVVETAPRLVVDVDDPPLRLETQLLGEHNATNVLLAAACAHRLGLSARAIEEGARTFEAIPHRLQVLPAPFGSLLDDVYNANPASMEGALRVLAEWGGPATRRGFVFGDMLDLGASSDDHHRGVLRLALELGIDVVFPVGRRATAVCREVGPLRVVVTEATERVASVREQLPGPNDVLLVKGSRALRLENLVDEILAAG